MEFSLLELTQLQAIVETHHVEISQNRKWFHHREMTKKILDKVEKAIIDEMSKVDKMEISEVPKFKVGELCLYGSYHFEGSKPILVRIHKIIPNPNQLNGMAKPFGYQVITLNEEQNQNLTVSEKSLKFYYSVN